jgi:hypothetical protein
VVENMTKHRRFEFLLSSLPDLEAFGIPPSMGKMDFLDRLNEARGPICSVRLIFLSDDLIQRDSILAGEIPVESADMAVIDFKAEDEETDLPDFLRNEEDGESADNARVAVDALWQRYFRHAHFVSHQIGSRFLRSWVGFEVALRNSLVVARAQRLDLDPSNYLVAPEVADTIHDTSSTITNWSNAPDPLAAQEVLDKARWEWIEEHGRWYSFRGDELEAYGAKLILLHRWHRIMSEKSADAKL